MSYDDDDFELNPDELNEESRMTLADEAMSRVLESIEKCVAKAKDNLVYCEREEFFSNFTIISRYVGAIIDIQQLVKRNNTHEDEEDDEPELTDEEILERIEEIELSARELTYVDLKEYEKNKNKVEITKLDDSDELGF